MVSPNPLMWIDEQQRWSYICPNGTPEKFFVIFHFRYLLSLITLFGLFDGDTRPGLGAHAWERDGDVIVWIQSQRRLPPFLSRAEICLLTGDAPPWTQDPLVFTLAISHCYGSSSISDSCRNWRHCEIHLCRQFTFRSHFLLRRIRMRAGACLHFHN